MAKVSYKVVKLTEAVRNELGGLLFEAIDRGMKHCPPISTDPRFTPIGLLRSRDFLSKVYYSDEGFSLPHKYKDGELDLSTDTLVELSYCYPKAKLFTLNCLVPFRKANLYFRSDMYHTWFKESGAGAIPADAQDFE